MLDGSLISSISSLVPLLFSFFSFYFPFCPYIDTHYVRLPIVHYARSVITVVFSLFLSVGSFDSAPPHPHSSASPFYFFCTFHRIDSFIISSPSMSTNCISVFPSRPISFLLTISSWTITQEIRRLLFRQSRIPFIHFIILLRDSSQK